MLEVFDYCQVNSGGVNFELKQTIKNALEKQTSDGIFLFSYIVFSNFNNCSDWILLSVNRNVSFEIDKRTQDSCKPCFVALCCFAADGGAGEAQCDVCAQGKSGAVGRSGPTAPNESGGMWCWRHRLSVRLQRRCCLLVLVFLFFGLSDLSLSTWRK